MSHNRPKRIANTQHEALVHSGSFARRGRLAPSREGAAQASAYVKTVQELVRHANSRITLEVYTQAITSNKRAAQSKVVRMMVPNLG